LAGAQPALELVEALAAAIAGLTGVAEQPMAPNPGSR
jgi:hypothetical protein